MLHTHTASLTEHKIAQRLASDASLFKCNTLFVHKRAAQLHPCRPFITLAVPSVEPNGLNGVELNKRGDDVR